MKQHITIEQMQELSTPARKLLKEWFFTAEYEPDLLTIGQMIEFLHEHYKGSWSIGDYWSGGFGFIQGEGSTEDEMNVVWVKPELCDALWEAVKEVLEK